MIAATLTSYEGPQRGLQIGEVPEPEEVCDLVRAAGAAVAIDVRCAAVSFPELLQSRGEYQYQPPLPFVPGSEIAGTVSSAPDDSGFSVGDPVFAYCGAGGFAEKAVAPVGLTFALPAPLDFAAGAALFSNYHTAYFALAMRGRCREGETVAVHGASGGVGTASLQVAKALGLRTVAIVSTQEKGRVAKQALADDVLLSTGPWKDELLELTGGVDLVVEAVGDRAIDSIRALREGGRLLIVGFAAGAIPEIKANRLLLTNTEVIGVGYGAYAFPKPEVSLPIAAELERMVEEGFVRPIIGERFPLADATVALGHLEARAAAGKVVLEIGDRR